MALRFDPMDAAFIADPYPTYARLRVEDPVHRSPLGFWVVTRYDDVATLLRDPRLLKAPSSDVAAARFGVAVPLTMLDMDPPDHTRLRGLVSQAFTPRAVEALRPRIQQIVDELLANIDARRDVARARPIDLIEQFAYPLPVIVICELLGVPLADHERFRSWSLDMARSLDAMMLPPGSDVLRRGLVARQALVGYFRELLAERRRQPRADMISALIAAEAQGERLSEDELLSTCVLLFVAGHETTVNVIGNGTLALLNNPEALHRLRTEPTLIASAVEEILRFDGPVHATSRFPSEDIVVRGTAIARGEMVMLFLASANRDPAHFENPDRLDIGRGDARHLAFSAGIHFCVGATLARVVGQIAIHSLFQHSPNLALKADRPAFRESLTLRGLKELLVEC